jgi:bacterial/archaeal transporter family protein
MALPRVLKAKWFWYSMLCVVCWGMWALFAKLGSSGIPATTMEFLFPFGCLPVVLVLLATRRFRLERSLRGTVYGTVMGALGGLGGLALFAAYRTGGNTAVITTVSAMYPMITVVLALVILRERLTRVQWLGLAFAVAAFVIFSL